MGDAKRDANLVATLIGVSSADGITPVTIYVDPTTHRVLTSGIAAPGGSDTYVQFNDGGALSGDAGMTYNKTTDSLTVVGTVAAGTLTEGGNAVPNATDKLSFFAATSSAEFAGVISDETGSGKVVFSTSPGFTTAANPATSDGATLGTTSLMWSDIFLAAGAVINFNNGDVTITHTSNVITIDGGTLAMATNKITGVGDPTNAQDVATKAYVDAVAQGLSVKPSAIVATTAVLDTYVYANGSSGVGATITMVATGVIAIDGHNLALNDVVLVKNETAGNAPYNGLYTVTVAGALGVALVLTRHTSMDTTLEFAGGFVFVEIGTVNAAAGFVCTNSAAVTVGSTSIAFTQFSGAGEITAGNGLTKTGNTIDAVGTADRISVSADAIDIAATYAGQISITILGTVITGNVDAVVSASSLTVAGKVELATSAEINTGTDTTRTMPIDQFVASNRNVRYILYRVIDSATDWSANGTTVVGGDLELPFTGTITEIGAYVDTAGTTGTAIVDVNLNGTTLMTTNKLSFDSTEKSTRTAATAPTLTTTAVTVGDLITVDIDTNHTTKSKGLTVRLGIRMT